MYFKEAELKPGLLRNLPNSENWRQGRSLEFLLLDGYLREENLLNFKCVKFFSTKVVFWKSSFQTRFIKKYPKYRRLTSRESSEFLLLDAYLREENLLNFKCVSFFQPKLYFKKAALKPGLLKNIQNIEDWRQVSSLEFLLLDSGLREENLFIFKCVKFFQPKLYF